MNDFIEKLVKHFPGYEADPRYLGSYWQRAIVDTDGHGLFFDFHNPKRVVISGVWPLHPDNDWSISVARDKPIEKIAADIQRRFMPPYLEVFDKQAAIANERVVFQRRVEATKNKLLAIEGTRACPHSSAVYAPNCLTLNVQGPDSIRLECRGNVSLKAAKRIIEIMRGEK